MNSSDIFRKAVKLAKSGQKIEARNLLLELVEDNPKHELAWIWLSQLVDDPEDRIIALENALTINPNRPETAVRLEKLRQKQAASLNSPPDLYQIAKQKYRDGRQADALRSLQKLVSEQPAHTNGWLALSALEPKIEDQMLALTHVLENEPEHEKARQKLDQLKQSEQIDYLTLGQKYEKNGFQLEAAAAYKKVEKGNYTATDKAIAKKHRQLIETSLKEPKPIKNTSPTTHLIRLTIGPILVYILLVLIQSGLNPLHISPILFLSGTAVTAGSLLLVGTANAPDHPWWQRLLGPEGLVEIKKRKMMALLGLVLIMIPFTLVLLIAFSRLSAYEATFTFSAN